MKKFLISVFAVLLMAVSATAQNITVEAPSVVALNEQFSIRFSVDAKPSSYEWTQGEAFQLVWGPSTGSSTSISIINGKHSKVSSYTFTYVLLPKTTGTFSLPAFHAVVDGKDLYSRSVKIEVVSDGASQHSQQGQSSSQSSSQAEPSTPAQDYSAPASSSADIFMRFSLSRTSVVVGEPITATLKLYTRTNISGFEDAKFPSFNGFWAQEIESPQNIEFQRESVGDKIYNSAVLRRWLIIPQKTGNISIDPAELVCLVQQRISSGNSIFDGFFDDYQTIRKRIVTSAYTVNVKALPAGAPASFTGAVGSYSIKASLSKDSLKVHDAATLTVSITGKGNISLVGAPKPVFPPDTEIYDTKTSDNPDKGSGGTSGTKTFEYPFIPRSYGDFEIEPIEFTYYDITTHKYVTLRTKALPYSVAKGEGGDYVPSGGVNIPTSNKKDVKNLSSDIHFITTKMPVLSSEGRFFVASPWFIVLLVLIVLIALAAGFAIKKVRIARNDIVTVRTRKASKMARKRLASAGSYLDRNLYAAFYEELHRALLGYASDKLNISAADLSKESIASAFASASVPSALISEYTELLDKCEYARYSPAAGNEDMRASFDKAAAVISTMDETMKKIPSRAVKAIVVALMLTPTAFANAQNTDYVDSLWNSAVAAYSDGNYELAASEFNGIVQLGLSSPELYTNLGNAYLKTRNKAQAILYYERALKLDPSCRDAKYNLEIARETLQDRIDSVPEFFLTTWNRKVCYSLSSNVWAALALVMLALTAVLLLVFYLARSSAARKTGFFSAIVTFLLFVLCLCDSIWQRNDYINRDSAIVTRSVCSAKSAPSGANDLFVLHEGTKVRVKDTVGEWSNIVLSDGREGWLKSSDIEVI